MIKQALPCAILGIVLLLWGSTGVSLVNSDQEGAHYRFGKLQE
jgi:regulator of protease activity HflC (stomatin/prohibitin superfamily)